MEARQQLSSRPTLRLRPPFKKLRGEDNWTTRKMLIEVHLGDYLDCLTQELNQTHQEDRLSVEFKRDQHARRQLLFGVEENLLTHIAGSATAYQIWTKLCNVFEDKGARRRAGLLKALVTLKQTGDLTEYIVQFKAAVQKISATGEPFGDQDMLSVLLLQGVKAEHLNYCQLLEHTCESTNAAGKKYLPFVWIAEQLMREGMRVKSSNSALKVVRIPHHH